MKNRGYLWCHTCSLHMVFFLEHLVVWLGNDFLYIFHNVDLLCSHHNLNTRHHLQFVYINLQHICICPTIRYIHKLFIWRKICSSLNAYRYLIIITYDMLRCLYFFATILTRAGKPLALPIRLSLFKIILSWTTRIQWSLTIMNISSSIHSQNYKYQVNK